VSRTNIELDDRLVAEVMRCYRLTSKKEAVELALRFLVGIPLSREEALALLGSGWQVYVRELRRRKIRRLVTTP